eukprot:GHVQ01019283.1.p1 GENE.GHVQ01019283.1~~GHVQ01019283.1.p1  ORF type:complete len:230 (+),score=24.82 GHVQ01019283.1:387-1076(+)
MAVKPINSPMSHRGKYRPPLPLYLSIDRLGFLLLLLGIWSAAVHAHVASSVNASEGIDGSSSAGGLASMLYQRLTKSSTTTDTTTADSTTPESMTTTDSATTTDSMAIEDSQTIEEIVGVFGKLSSYPRLQALLIRSIIPSGLIVLCMYASRGPFEDQFPHEKEGRIALYLGVSFIMSFGDFYCFSVHPMRRWPVQFVINMFSFAMAEMLVFCLARVFRKILMKIHSHE